MIPSERSPQSRVQDPHDRELPCPALGRFWDVALGGSWSTGEQGHVASCPRCLATERTIGSAVGGRASDDRDSDRPDSRDGAGARANGFARPGGRRRFRTRRRECSGRSSMVADAVDARRRRPASPRGGMGRGPCARIEETPVRIGESERRTLLRELTDIELALVLTPGDDRHEVDESMMWPPEDAGSIDETVYAGPELTWSGGGVTGIPEESVSMSTRADLDTIGSGNGPAGHRGARIVRDAAEPGRLPGVEGTRERRHGDRLPGPRRRPRPARGAQGHPALRHVGWPVPGAFPALGAAHRRPPPSVDRADLQRRPGRRPALHRQPVHRGERALRRHAASRPGPSRRCGPDRRPDRRGPAMRP